jgi:hypothetical protein
MIVRILNEGQWELDEAVQADLNRLDEAVERAVRSEDSEQLTAALTALLQEVRAAGRPLPDDELHDSDLILPDSDATLDDVRALLTDSEEGLVPN